MSPRGGSRINKMGQDMEILSGLNPAQRQAVETVTGPLLIIAGPGSGKTKVIAHRVAYLVGILGTNPRRIMAVTFTNKAANEMKHRLCQLLGQATDELTLGTFHAICCRILHQEGERVSIDPKFVIYDEDDQLNLIKRSLQEIGLDPKQANPKAIHRAITGAKSQLMTPEDYADQARSYFEEIVQRVYQHYQQLLGQSKALDFDDLIMRTVHLFRSQPQILARYQSRYLYLLIDEFQDTNIAQYALARQLAGRYGNICVVGDPDQSIYSWRCADLRNILNFEKDYPEAKVVYLEQSYRSSQTILNSAQQVISRNKQRKEKKVWSDNEIGAPVALIETEDAEEEAQFVVSEIERLASQGEVSPGECAVMYRTNAQSRAIEEAFIRYGMPYQLVGALRFYERREIKDVIAYLRLIHNPYDSVSLARIINVPGRGIGQRTLTELARWANAQSIPLYAGLELIAAGRASPSLPRRSLESLINFFALLKQLIAQSESLNVADLLDFVLQASRYQEWIRETDRGEERWDNILELRAVANGFRGLEPKQSLASFLDQVTLVSEVDNLDENKDTVTLITLHQAKGLEFGTVFIVGMEEGILPHRRSFAAPAQMEEERRLCYVGMTRAKSHLYLVYAQRRSLFGSSSGPSRFLRDIPPHSVKPVGEQRKATPVLLALEAGDQVCHAKFGQGVVRSCTSIRDDHEIIVDFQGGVGTKRLLLSLAPLERVK